MSRALTIEKGHWPSAKATPWDPQLIVRYGDTWGGVLGESPVELVECNRDWIQTSSATAIS